MKKWLQENADAQFAQFNRRINRNTSYPILGVRVPLLRKKAAELIREKGIDSLELLDDDSLESVMIQSFVIAGVKMDLKDKTDLIYDFLLKCDEWCLVDGLVASLKIKKKESDEFFALLEKWENDSYEFVRRFVLVSMMGKYLDDEHIEKVIDYCSSLHDQPYYVAMAQAWLLATAYIHYPKQVIEAAGKIDSQTLQMTKRKIHDSFRITDEKKKQFDEVKNGNN